MKNKLTLITTGDPDGIGLEVTLKALLLLGNQKKREIVVCLSHQHVSYAFKKLRVFFSSSSKTKVHLIGRKDAPPLWVEDMARLCLKNKSAYLVTAPMSKVPSSSGPVGHTEILKNVCFTKSSQKNKKTPSVTMCFLGPYLNVVSVTGHVPLAQVSPSLSTDLFVGVVAQASLLKKALPRGLNKKPIALVGLNPHSGEGGLIGREEILIYKKALLRLQKLGIFCQGPLSPDAAFLPENREKYSFFVCAYHDQALIPFKALHGPTRGCQYSMGLPIVRTSVDHGTAKDIYGKNKANPGSMIDALLWAERLSALKSEVD